METFALVIIGSGPAGVSAAAAYVDAGGPGPVLLVSADTDPPYERPPLSKEVLAGASPATGTPIEPAIPAGVEVRLGVTVGQVDLVGRTLQAGEATIGFDRMVLATGSTPRPLEVAEEGADVHLLRSLERARRLVTAAEHARTAVVIGSGFIGCEAAASLARRGVAVTLVTPEPGPQQRRLGPYVAERITDWLTELGVELRTGTEVTGVTAPRTVHLSDGTTLAPDLVLAALGVTQNGDLLGGTEAQVHEGRVVADQHLQAAPGVWVAGDASRAHHPVAGRPVEVEHWQDALTMGEIAGHNAAADAGGQAAKEWGSVPGFWSTIGERTLKYTAWGDGYESEQVVEGPGSFTVWYADGDGVVVGVCTSESDDDYERGERLVEEGASLEEAVSG